MRLLLFAVIALAGPAVAGTHAPPDAPDTPAVCSPEAPDVAQSGLDIAAAASPLALAAELGAPEPLIDGGRVAASDYPDQPAPYMQPPNRSADTPQPDTEQEAPVARVILPESFAPQAPTAPNTLALAYPEDAATGIGVTAPLRP